jgi:predicted dehydrogenase
MAQRRLSRRRFLQSVAAAAAAGPFLSIPSPAFGATTLRHASVGAAGQALSDLNAFAKHPAFELVAVADVDLCRMEPLQKLFPRVRVYQDWREMLKKERSNIDSVNVSLPDHMHCAVTLEAMKHGKHVYVQKPLCHTLRETRLLTKEARRRGLTTQMGIQVSSSRPQRYGEALVRSGIVGKIKEVHTFSNKNWGDDTPLPEAVDPVPAPFDWEGWVGVSAARPFKRGAYHPGEWRRRVGFGTGTLGDMGCHIYSPPYRALELTSPVSVIAYGPAPSDESWATKARVKLTYPGTGFTAGSTVDVWWYDGGELPPDAIREPIGARFPDQGSVLVGTEGLLVLPHGSTPAFVLPESRMPSPPEIDIPERDHYREFVDVVLAGGTERCSASFDYAGPLTESVLIGNIAAHFPGEALAFDAKALSFPRKRDANQYLTRSYRNGWGMKT